MRRIGVYKFSPAALGVYRTPQKVTAPQLLAEHPDVFMAAAAPMYSRTGSFSCPGPCTLLFDSRTGVNFPGAPQVQDSGVTISIVNGQAVAKQGATKVPGATVAVQGWPSLVWNGVPTRKTNRYSSVAGLGLLRDGNLLYIVGASGSFAELADEFVRHGAVAALYTDASASAALYLRDGGWQGVHAGGSPSGPRLPGWIVASGAAPLDASGNPLSALPLATKVVVALLAVGITGGALWYATSGS